MSEPSKSRKRTDLKRSCDEFLKSLKTQGYANSTVIQYKKTVDKFFREATERHLVIRRLDESAFAQIEQAVLAGTTGSTRKFGAYRLARLIQYLVEAGIVSRVAPAAKIDSPRESLCREYERYLRTQRGLSDATIYHCVRFYERFMTFRFGDGLGDLKTLTANDIVVFLRQLAAVAQRDKTPPTHLRSLFKFLFWTGRTKSNLADSIPRIAQRPPLALPRSLSRADVQRLLDSVRTDDSLGRRNYAMLLLMARLGLRATEVVTIQLDDIHWRAGEILVRGKGQLHDAMPLPPDVGASLADYIRNDRKGTSRVVFVLDRAPHRPFTDGQIVNSILRRAFVNTGLKPPQKYVGSHILRHSLAMDMLGHGTSLDEIGDVLRHRSRMTTTIYAKHDIESLRSIAQEWPVSKDTP